MSTLSSSPTALHATTSRPTSRRGLLAAGLSLDIVLAAALLALVSFSLPGRESPDSAGGLDWIALAKFAIRLGVIVWFGGYCCWQLMNLGAVSRHRQIARGALPNRYASLLVPWFAFTAWSGVTIVWSPLKSVSAGQWLGLLALVIFAQAIALRYRPAFETPSSVSQRTWTGLVVQLYWILWLYSVLLLGVHTVAPELSGLDRSIQLAGNNGFIHPTAAGATSSLGIVLAAILCLRSLTRFKYLVAVSSLAHLVVLFMAESRAALAMAAITVILCGTLLVSTRARGWAMFAIGAILLLYLFVDPGFDILASGFAGTTEYIQRGQSTAQLSGVSGRVEMWQAIWEQAERSPWIGHGYFVTSSTGKLDVWDGPSNHDAHHVLLQVLVTTGGIGLLLFAWALLRSLYGLAVVAWSASGPKDRESRRELAWLLAMLAIWFGGWSQGCVTFLGPIRPESVLFFVLLGLLAAASPPASVDHPSIRSRT